MAKQNARKVVSKTTTKSDLKLGERRVPSSYKSFYHQNYDPKNIYPMLPADTLGEGTSKPGYRVDLSRSKKISREGPEGPLGWHQTEYIKLAPNSGKKSTTPATEKKPTTKKPTTAPTPSKSEPVGNLAIKKATTIATKSDDRIKAPKYKVPVAIERPGKGGGLKKVTGKKAGSSFGKRVTKNVGLTDLKGRVKGAVANAKFNREEKLAGAYERNKAGLSGTSKEKVAELKANRKYLRSKEMLRTGAGTTDKSRAERAQALAKERKSIRQAERYVKKEVKGKVKYFTQEAMNKTQELTAAEMNKRKKTNQAGKVRYSS